MSAKIFQLLRITTALLTVPVFAVPRAIVLYLYHHRSVRKNGYSAYRYIFVAVTRWIWVIMVDGQTKCLPQTSHYLEPIANQPFRAVWIAKCFGVSKDHEKVLLWFHGGGYAWGPVEFYFSTLADLHAKLNTTSSPISVLFLDYSFTPEFKYPSQLSEAALAYNYLLSDLQIDPANIILGSDSAGSNLALQLLRHIETPHPKVPIRIIPSSRPGKCILVSPWTSQSVASPSFHLNESYDVITKRQLQSWGDRWADGKCDEFTDPLLVDDNSWASILPPTLVISGEQEIMQDDIKLFCTKLKKSGCKVLEDHRKGKFHDWWWIDIVVLGVNNSKAYEANDVIKNFIISS